jgi:hypothetical protein
LAAGTGAGPVTGTVRWLRGFLRTREGVAVITGSLGASFALGMLPEILSSLPGPALLWQVVLGGVGLLLVMVSTYLLHHREGVGIVLYLRSGRAWDGTRLQAMTDDARRKHATCFTVNVDELLGGEQVRNRAAFAFRLMQARLAEGVGNSGGRGVPESASFYVTAQLSDAYELGQLLKFQVHDDVDVYAEAGERQVRVQGELMGMSEERGQSVFPAVGLDSRLQRTPDAADAACLEPVLAGEPEWRELPGNGASSRIALVLRVSDKPMVQGALEAAQTGTSGGYAFPGERPAEVNRCGGALVIDTRPGNIPDRREVYEALIRHVAHHWKRALDRWGEQTGREARGVLFTDAPATIVVALGAVMGRNTELVPYRPGPGPSADAVAAAGGEAGA